MTLQEDIIYFALPAAAYLLGSIPFAFVIGRAHGIDIRTVGSKNVGATNLGRTLGMRFFWYAFFLDAAKGFVPVLTAALFIRYYNSSLPGASDSPLALPAWPPILTGGLCLIGHLFPLWLKFRGGKGVATSFGVVLGFWPLYTVGGIAGGLFFVVMLMVYRFISLASMTGSIVFVLTVWLLGGWHNPLRDHFLAIDTYLPWPQRWPLVLVAGVFSALIILRHRANIVRLFKGTEPTIKWGQATHPR